MGREEMDPQTGISSAKCLERRKGQKEGKRDRANI